MIDPLPCARNILLNNPALAEDLLDILIWANQPDLKENGDYDEMKNLCFVKLQSCRDARDAYESARTGAAPEEIALLSTASS